ncbi:hypothetical protein AZE42_04766 [Rhizopogon vesiculosus]|uniref:Uncharacterized protein n=1 Tax=Rhizopogon vesiculosus TaxID=180088 RepID=A0A1J8QTU7_9AGAM|nr:hypothetical protein AZE42_04766 [Rhizopogon vesiculosus]
MPPIRRGSTYLDVSTTPHTPAGRLKFVPVRAGANVPYKNAVCTTLLFICDENRDLHASDSTDTLRVSVADLQTSLRSLAKAAGMKLGPCKYAKLRPALMDLACYRHIELPFTEVDNNKSGVEHFDILPSFRDIHEGFQQVLDKCGMLSARTKYRAYMSLAVKVFGSNRPLTVHQAVKCAVVYSKRCEELERSTRGDIQTKYSREHLPSDMVDGGVQMDEDEPSASVDQVNDVGDNEINQDFYMAMGPEGPNDVEVADSSRQVVPVTPIRPLNRNCSNREIGLPTPESLPRRPGDVVMPLSPPLPSNTMPSGSGGNSHSDNRNEAPGSFFRYFPFGSGLVSGILHGFRLSSNILLPEISSLHTRVIDLQTSLAAAEQALTGANETTAESQRQCLKILQDLSNAESKIASLEARATEENAEKLSLQQEVANLKGEVSRLQSGVEQITRIAGGLFPALAVVSPCTPVI